MLRNLSTRSYVSLGLSFILVTIMLVAILLGLIPDRAGAIRQSRATIAEAIAANGSAFIDKSDVERLRTTLRLVIDRNEDLLSAVVRRTDGEVVVSVGDHERHWREGSEDISTDANVKVPIRAGGKRWGRIELRFAPLLGTGRFDIVQDQRLHLLLFIVVVAFFAFRTYLGRVLRHLDPAQAVPPHVRSALDTLAEGLIVVDKRENVVLANAAFATIVGQTTEQLLGRRASEIGFVTADGAAVTAAASPWKKALTEGTPQRNEMLHLDDADNQQRSFIVNCSPVLGTGGDHAGVLISLDDVTQLEANKVALSESKDAAEAANLAKSDFLANMSHEIRTPMNAILGFTDVLRRGYDRSTTDRRKYLDTIHTSGKHLLQLINDVLDLSKVEAGRLEVERLVVPVHLIVREVMSVLKIRAEEKGIDLNLEINGDIPETIQSDPTRLRQIVTNLVGNAIKFTESGGVRVLLGMQDAGEAPDYSIRVIDSGIGIEHDDLEAIFEPFVQADAGVTRRFGGTGLGLAISRRFARLLGGDIVAHSTAGNGTVLVVTLATGPLDGVRLLTAAEALAAQAGSDPEQAAGWRFPPATRVLVVDDGEENRELVQLVLENVGLEIVCAENGQEAVTQALAHRFDAILMDMQMPVMDGYEATSRLRDEGLEAPIIALTADAMKGFEQKCLAAGCTGYLTKPVDIDALLEVLADHLNGSRDSSVNDAAVATPAPDVPTERLAHGAPIVSKLAAANPAIRATVAKFIDGLNARFDGARVALEAGDLDEVARFAHWLKGAGGTVGFNAFTQPAAVLEQHAKNGRGGEIDQALTVLEAIGRRLMRPGDDDAAAAVAVQQEPANNAVTQVVRDESPIISQLPLTNPRLRATVEKFLVRLDERMVDLQQAIAVHDCDRVIDIATWLKGAAGTVGFAAFIEPAHSLAQWAKQGSCTEVQACQEEIQDLVRRIEVPPERPTARAKPGSADSAESGSSKVQETPIYADKVG